MIFVLVAVGVAFVSIALVTLLVVAIARTSRRDQNPGGSP